jgi:hypothetical protein
MAAELEAAAKKEDKTTIMNNHKQVIELYTRLADAIRIKIAINDSDELGDDEILEFLPE